MKVTIHDLGEPLDDPARLALCGGIALYLLGNVAFRLRMVGAVGYAKLAGAAGLLVVFALGGGLSALWVTALATLVARHAVRARDARARLAQGVVCDGRVWELRRHLAQPVSQVTRRGAGGTYRHCTCDSVCGQGDERAA